jgi:cyanophycinase
MRSTARPSISILACVGLAACVGGEAPDPDPAAAASPARAVAPVGRLVIVGGGLDEGNADVYEAIVDGRDGDGPLCVLPTASGVPESSMASAVSALGRYAGVGAVTGVLLTMENAQRAADAALVAELERCAGYFFTGGDQSRVVDTFLPAGDTTPAFRTLHRRWTEGAVVSGSSAGAAMMSGVMIASGSSADALRYGVVPSEGDGVWIRPGMGFFGRGILDQHFLARGRVGRLMVATLVTDSLPVGLGIDENTALVVDGDTALVVGASGVIVVDARDAVAEGQPLGSGIRLSLAGAGDRVDLRTFAVTRAAGKTPIPPGPAALDAPSDPFARWAFLHLLSGLARTTAEQATFALPGAVLVVREGAGFSAAHAAGESVEGEPAGLSAGPFVVDLLRPSK